MGNDYIYVDLISNDYVLPWSQLAQAASDRHFGIGSDGVILIMPSESADVRMRIFNADGSEGEMCGNGIRCVAKYLYDSGMIRKTSLTIETLAGVRNVIIQPGSDGLTESVTVDMGEPRLKRSEIPMAGEPAHEPVIEATLPVGDVLIGITAVSIGNPHAVTFVSTLDRHEVEHVGQILEKSPWFPQRVNVEFVQVINTSEIRMRVWERGSGETMACGTGACASVVAGVLTGRTGKKVTVHLLGGDLSVEWSEEDNHLWMTGPASYVFRGYVDVDRLLRRE